MSKRVLLDDLDIQDLTARLGNELRRIRRYQELTLQEVAEKIGNGLTKPRLSLIENGSVGLRVSLGVYLRLFAFYGVELHLVNSGELADAVFLRREAEEEGKA